MQAHCVHDQALAFGLQVECISVRDHSRAIGEIRAALEEPAEEAPFDLTPEDDDSDAAREH